MEPRRSGSRRHITCGAIGIFVNQFVVFIAAGLGSSWGYLFFLVPYPVLYFIALAFSRPGEGGGIPWPKFFLGYAISLAMIILMSLGGAIDMVVRAL